MGAKIVGILLMMSLGACRPRVATHAAAYAAPAATATFTNPLLPTGPDPWVCQKDGFYYFLATTGGDISIRKTARMSELAQAPPTVVWRPTSAANARDVWAPELHFLAGKWYLYFTAGPGNCCDGQRLWVLENASPDPTQGTWTEKGRLASPTADFWAIDATVLEQGGRRYLVWSGHADAASVEQRLYISQMRNPWTLAGPRVELSRPQYAWERHGPVPVNEGPELLRHGGSTFLIYSASHCSTDDYALGMLRLRAGASPLVADNWIKSATPVFAQNPAGGAYGPGHCGFFRSKDGHEDWLIYHANRQPGQGCGNVRTPRMQPFAWNADGSPRFGVPAALSAALPRPSGE